MQMTGEQRITAPRHKVWDALNDPDVLRASIPGCQSLEREGENRFVATAEVKVGPIGARFKGAVDLSEIDAPNGYVLSGQGSGGIAGSAKGKARVRLTDDGAGTLLSYTVEAEVGGRMAQLGGPIIDATAKRMAGLFFQKFGEVVTGGVPEAAAVPAGAAPAAAPVAAGGLAWGWIAVIVLALVAGYLLGSSGASYGWVVGVAALTVAALLAGFRAGRGGGA